MFIETPKGKLKYRLPTIIENIKILRTVRECYAANDDLGAKIAIIEAMDGLLDYSELEGISNFSELNSAGSEMTAPVSELADMILGKVSEAFTKKP